MAGLRSRLCKYGALYLFVVLAVAYVKATGVENVLTKARGAEARGVILAALLGGLSPFCSCEVIPLSLPSWRLARH